jgi:hypothetical protein
MLLAGTCAHAEMSAEDLAKIAQNPVGNFISFPVQENMNVNVGPLSGNQNLQLATYYNLVRPAFAGNWQFRPQIQVLLSK